MSNQSKQDKKYGAIILIVVIAVAIYLYEINDRQFGRVVDEKDNAMFLSETQNSSMDDIWEISRGAIGMYEDGEYGEEELVDALIKIEDISYEMLKVYRDKSR